MKTTRPERPDQEPRNNEQLQSPDAGANAPLSAIAQRCRTARGKRTIGRLAKRARVSNRSIAIIESGNLAKELGGGKNIDRKMRAWASVLTKLALTLDQEPDVWLKEAGIELPESELKGIKTSARQRTLPGSRTEPDTLSWLRRELQARQGAALPLDVHLLTSDKSTHGQQEFYSRFCELVVRTIDPRIELRPTPEVRTFEGVMDGLSTTPPRHRLIAGAYEMIGRTQHGVIFIPIPGWRIRLAALALPDVKITWENIRLSGDGLTGKINKELKLLVINREAADVYLRSFCDFDAEKIDRIVEYDIGGAADRFQKELTKNKHTVFVIGEYEAAVLRSRLYKRHNQTVVDIAGTSESAPRYQLALVVAETDERWARTLRSAIDELFKNAGALMAEVYGQFMVDVIKETVNAEAKRGRDEREALKQILGLQTKADPGGKAGSKVQRRERGNPRTAHSSIISVPSYLQLHDFDFPVTSAFRHRLHDFLHSKLQELKLVDAQESFRPYFHSLTPWLRSDEEKTLRTAHRIRRKLARMSRRLNAQSLLLKKLLSHLEGESVEKK